MCRLRNEFKINQLKNEIISIYIENNGLYGDRRIHAILKSRGYAISRNSVLSICKSLNLKSIISLSLSVKAPKPYKKYETVSETRPFYKPPAPSNINEVWVTDWTRFFIDENTPIYVYCIMDLYSRKIINFDISFDGEDTDIEISALKKAIIYRNPPDSLIIHSDNDSSYKNIRYKSIFDNLNYMQSFNRVEFSFGDNSHMESFFATLNKEFYRPSFLNIDYKDLIYDISITPHLTKFNFYECLRNYINFYNKRRIHSSIGYITPSEFESSIKYKVPLKYSRVIMHVDINSCFAQYEMMISPHLKNKNLVVIGEEYKRDKIIVCASENARKYGIKCGDRLRYAESRVPKLYVRKSKKEYYKKLSDKFFNILYRYTDRVEPYGIDEAWIDVTFSLKLFKSPLNIANLIMKDLKREMGITVSIGISFNKIFAKLASDLHKPNAITQIPYKYFRKITTNLPVEMLLFVGEKSKVKFNKAGIKTIGDLAFANKTVVKNLVGEKNALKLIHFANGYEFTPVKLYGEIIPPKTISKCESTYRDITTCGELKLLINNLSEDVAYNLRQKNLEAQGLCVKLYNHYYQEKSMQLKIKTPTNSGSEIADKLLNLFLYKTFGNIDLINLNQKPLINFNDYLKLEHLLLPEPIREVMVIAYALQAEDKPLLDRFTDNKLRRFDRAADDLRNKYGRGVLQKASNGHPWWDRFQGVIGYGRIKTVRL